MSPYGWDGLGRRGRRGAARRGWLGVLLGLCLALGGAPPRTTLAAPGVALPHYQLAVSLDEDAASLSAREQLSFTNTYGVPLDELVFKTPAAAVAALTLSAMSVDGQAVSWSFDPSGTVLDVPLPASLAPDTATSVELDWSLQISPQPGRLSAAYGVISLGNWFPILAVHHGDWDRRVYTDVGDPFFSEVADYDVQLELARPAEVAFTGDLVSQGGTNWQISARSVRDLAMAVSASYQRVDAQVPNGPLVSVYALDATRAQAELDAARTYVAAYASLVGPYPLSTLRVAETSLQAAFSGMEYPGLVFISAALGPRASPTTLHGVVAHEVAHQWFYALMGDDELADPWLDEAFATYLADEASEMEPEQLSGAAGNTFVPAPSGPAIDQSVEDFTDNGRYAAAVYARGAGFLSDLRQKMGDPAWINFLRSLYTTFANKVETPRAVLDLAEQASPTIDLGSLIDAYTRYYAGDVARSDWTVTVPSGPRSGEVDVDVEAPFPLGSVDVWLDDWQVAHGSTSGVVSFDSTPVPGGDYVLLVRVTDAQGTVYERASRITVTP